MIKEIQNNKNLYKELANKEDIPLFFKVYWLDLITENSWNAYIIFDKSNTIIGIAAIPHQKKIFWNTHRAAIFQPYSGPYFFDVLQNTLENQILFWEKFLLENNSDWLDLTGFPDFYSSKLKEIKNNKFEYYPTFTIDLKQKNEVLFSQIKSRRRNYIRNCEKTLTIQSTSNPDFNKYLAWLQHSYERKGVKMPYTATFLNGVFKKTQNAKNSLFLEAIDIEKTQSVAALWILYDKRNAYQMWSAFNPNASPNGCMDLLIWEAWKILKDKGIILYDFEGSRDSGIARFFKNLGAKEYKYLHIHSPAKNILKWLKKIKDLKTI
ncbi:MAG TPA: GNAT family N-acetyltransferase [Chitinophagaceae bacterium]|nr:GNAT family N-acetyltransferase [Chitinophagaceae bacterium]